MIRDIGEIQSLATKYSKPQLARMAQMGLIDPTKAVMAGMMIDRITKSNMKAPQTTVAEEALTATPMPLPQDMQAAAPAGIGGLPAQPQANAGVAALPSGITEMAGGGIVAFDEGGEVPGYAGGDLILNPLDMTAQAAPTRTLQEIKAEEDRQRAIREQEQNVQRGYITGYNAIDARARSELASNVRRKLQNNIPLTQSENAFLSNIPEFKSLVESEMAKNPAPSTTTTTNASAPAARPDARPAARPAALDSRMAAPVARRQVSAQTGMQEAPTGLQSIPKVAELAVPQGLGSFTTKDIPIPNKRELKDSLKEREEADRIAGVNTDIYKDLMRDLEGKKGKLAERKQEAIGTALMQTGLGLLGARRGQEFAVLGVSGQRALQGLVNANEKIRDTEDKIDDSRRALLMAENDYKRNRSDKAFDDVQKNRDKIEALEIQNIQNKNLASQKQAEIGVQLFGQQVNLQGQKVQERGQDIQRQTSIDTERMRNRQSEINARIAAAASNRPGETERMMAEHDRILKTQGPEAAERYIQLKERIAGAGKPQNTFSYEEAMKIVAAKPANINASPQELARQARELMATSNPQQSGGGTLQRQADGTFTYQPPR